MNQQAAPMPNKFQSLFTSRRFITAVGAVLAVVLEDKLGLTQEQSMQIIAIAVAWILGDTVRKTE